MECRRREAFPLKKLTSGNFNIAGFRRFAAQHPSRAEAITNCPLVVFCHSIELRAAAASGQFYPIVTTRETLSSLVRHLIDEGALCAQI